MENSLIVDEFLAEPGLYAGPDRVISTEELRRILDEAKSAPFSAKTGIDELDHLTDGIEGGELVIVSGKTKHGKTTLLYTLTRNLSTQNIKTLWLSYEVPPRQFIQQLGRIEAYVPLTLASTSLDWIFRRYLEANKKYGCKVMMIDHLHYLIDLFRAKNPALEIGAVVRGLKRIAVEMEMVIFLVSHVRNIPKNEDATEEDLRDSGLTKAEADTTWIVTRLKGKDGVFAANASLLVANHRRTGVMGQKVKIAKRGLYFEPGHDDIPEEINGYGPYAD